MPVEVTAYASLGRHSDLVSYVRSHTVFPMDYHVAFWFVSVVLWACNMRISSVQRTFTTTQPQVVVTTLSDIRTQLQLHDYAPDDTVLSEAEKSEFCAAVAELEELEVLVSTTHGVCVPSAEAAAQVPVAPVPVAPVPAANATASSVTEPVTPAAPRAPTAFQSTVYTRTRSKAPQTSVTTGADVARRL